MLIVNEDGEHINLVSIEFDKNNQVVPRLKIGSKTYTIKNFDAINQEFIPLNNLEGKVAIIADSYATIQNIESLQKLGRDPTVLREAIDNYGRMIVRCTTTQKSISECSIIYML